MTLQEFKWLMTGVGLVLIAVLIGYLFAYFNVHLPWPPHFLTPTPTSQ